MDHRPRLLGSLRHSASSAPGNLLSHRYNYSSLDRELRWLGHLVTSVLFAGEQSFTIEPLSGGSVRFRQAERFTGILVPLMGLIGAFRNTHDDFV